jgi:Uma2 family endonuclease
MSTTANSGNASLPVVAAGGLLTPDDFVAIPGEREFELVEGRLVERNGGNVAGLVGSRLACKLHDYVEAHDLGLIFNSGAGFQLSAATIRKPSVSFVSRGRLPDDMPSSGYDALAPDLVVLVLAPNDKAVEVDFKREEYLRAGVRLIWIVSPETRTIQVYRGDGSTSLLHENDELSGEDVVPGFRCGVASVFGRPARKA